MTFKAFFEATGSILKAVLLKIFPFHAAAWRASTASISCILNAPEGTKKDQLAALWRDSIQAQLTTIAITGALVSSVTAAAFAWPLLQAGSWKVSALWYSSIMLSLTSISASTQQAVAIYRINSLQNGICKLLSSSERDEHGKKKPRLWQLYIWQIPLLLLNTSIYIFVAGLAVLLWEAAKAKAYDGGADETKIVIVFMAALGVSVSNYIISTVGIYECVRKDILPKRPAATMP